MVGYSNGANSSSFTYDGLGRLVRVVDKVNGAVAADHSYFWCGGMRCLAHDNTQSGSPVSTAYYRQGSIVGNTPYYYVKDRLGSVRALISAGSVVARYDYDPYGNRAVLSGTFLSDIGYAGYLAHVASGLQFTLGRAYDSIHARFLNRDPLAEIGGVNLYAYVGGNPLSRLDPLGLCAANAIPVGIGIGGAAGLTIGTGVGLDASVADAAELTEALEGGFIAEGDAVIGAIGLADTVAAGALAGATVGMGVGAVLGIAAAVAI